MYWDPFEEFERIQEELNSLFKRTGNLNLPAKTGARTPIADVKETEQNILVTFELPGVDKKDIDLNVTEDSVEVKVKGKQEAEKKTKEGYSYKASAYNFYRRMPLPTPVISEKAEATYKNGILRIEIPKKQEKLKGSRKVQIK